jgi:hypothetical protein
MDSSEQDPPDGEVRPIPSARPPAQEDSDWLLSWSRSTRQEPVRPRRTTERSKWRPRPPKFGPLLARVEARRLAPILDGSAVRIVETPDGPRRALVHRHWAGLAMRMTGAVAALLVAIVVSPAFLALALLAGGHALLVSSRRGIKRHLGGALGGAEFVLGWLIGAYLGEGWLRAVLILGALVTATLTVVAWQVDMELITEGGRLVRTRGLLLFKRTVAAPLTSIRIADIAGPFFGLGLVTVDTTSDHDQLLHNFGLIGQPNEWATLLLREASHQAVSAGGD